MKSNEFITEDTSRLEAAVANTRMIDSQAQEFLSTVVNIKKECQPFLNEIEDPFSLLRGLSPTPFWSVKKNVRLDNRSPMSTPGWLHAELNDLFTRHFGAPFRDSLFCTGSSSQARIYGMAFCIFPIGNYKYLWSPEYRDLYNDFDNFRLHNNQHDFIDRIDLKSYRTDRLNDAIASGRDINSSRGGEIMLRCNSYYGLNMNNLKIERKSGPLLNAIQEYWMS